MTPCLNCSNAPAEPCGLCLPCAILALDNRTLLTPTATALAAEMRDRVNLLKPKRKIRHARPTKYRDYIPGLMSGRHRAKKQLQCATT
jgi:hypothetical protein